MISGGSGTRLWPLSTDARPKLFHKLDAARTFREATALRFSDVDSDITFLAPNIIAGAPHADLLHSLLAAEGVKPSAVVLEPMRRNTAATAVLATTAASEIDPEAYVLLVPTDHLVAMSNKFALAVQRTVNTLDSINTMICSDDGI